MPVKTMARAELPAAIGVDLGAIFDSLELSKSTWLVTALTPGSEKMSRYNVAGRDLAGLFGCFKEQRRKAQVSQATIRKFQRASSNKAATAGRLIFPAAVRGSSGSMIHLAGT